MELKRLISHFTYRIESRPEGGFIAHASDPNLPPLEAATREELQRKIQANIAAGLAAEFPGLKLAPQGQELKFAFHIEQKPGGGFAIHTGDPNAQSIEGATHQEIESHFLERLITFLGKHAGPELSQALAAQGNTGDVKVFVNRKLGLTVTASRKSSVNTADNPTHSDQSADARIDSANAGDGATNSRLRNPGQTISNAPITPESSGSWKIFPFLLALVIISALMYFLFFHRG